MLRLLTLRKDARRWIVIRRWTVIAALFLSLASHYLIAEGLTGKAPDFSLEGLDKPISLADARGQVVYIDFWASWCGPCRESFPWLETMQKRYQDQGFQVIAVNLDRNRDDALNFLNKMHSTLTVGFDPQGSTPSKYQVMGMPSSFLIDQNGQIFSQHTGFHANEKERYEKEIQLLIQRKMGSTP